MAALHGFHVSLGKQAKLTYAQLIYSHIAKSGLQPSKSIAPAVCYSKTRDSYRSYQVRHMSNGRRPGFLESLIKNVQEGFGKDEKLKESLKAFREQTQKLEESESLKEARRKYESIEAESSALKKKLEEYQKKASETWDEAQKNEYLKKASELGTKLAESAKRTSETIGNTDIFKQVTEGLKSVKDELDDAAKVSSRHYSAPSHLKKRTDYSTVKNKTSDKQIDADTTSTGVVMHKDSRWSQSWQSFKDNNPYMHKMFDLKAKYDESDNIAIKMTRSITDKLGHLFGSMSKTELSTVMTEICKIDPNFEKEKFLKFCKSDIIPNVLEAMLKGNLEVLEDWCFEATYNVHAEPIKQMFKNGYVLGSQILDIEGVDLLNGQMMEQGPVLLVQFNTQQIMVAYDKSGKVIDGDPQKVMKYHYVMALCRDQQDVDPITAWRVIEIQAAATEQWL